MRRAARVAHIALLAVVTGACAAGSSGDPTSIGDPTPPADLTIFAAASLGTAVERAAEAYIGSAATTIVISTDSSAALATQIEQGAPADVFLSADTTNPQRLLDGGFGIEPPVEFAGNELAIIVPLGNPGALQAATDLGRPGLRIVAAGEDVPITRYAAELLANLAAEPGAPAGLEAAYAANVVSREDNAGAVVAKIELGEGDAAIVYATDAEASTGLETIVIPADANVPATYAGIVVSRSQHPTAARAFLDWFAGPDGWAILADLGFLPPPG